MTYFVGVLTVRLTVGFTLVVVPVLLEMTPLASTPVMVKVYALLGVIPLGVVVCAAVAAAGGRQEKRAAHDEQGY